MTRFQNPPFALSAILLLSIFFAVMGCSKVTSENYNKLNSGMTYEQVQEIIGEPTSCESSIGIKSCAWEEGDKSIKVKFLADKVFLFSSKNL